MQWSDYVAVIDECESVKPFIVRAVSVKHALTKAQRQYPDAKRHEVTKCRCSEINNDMCEAHYLYHFNQ
jgi:hypothetical protein